MQQYIKEAIAEVTDESKLDASLRLSKIKEEQSLNTQSDSSARKNLHISLRNVDVILDDKEQKLTTQKSQSIDVNALRSLSNKTPSARLFDQNFFYNDQKIPNRVQDEFQQLSGFIGDLNTKIAEIVLQNEQDFLRVYKEQMKEIYGELLRLKRRIEDEDFKFKKNTKIMVLSEEKNYFQRQAIFLDERCRNLEHENNELKFKYKIMKEDLFNYQGLLIESKRETKQLKTELLFLYENRSLLPQNMKDQMEKSNNKKSEQRVERQINDLFFSPKNSNNQSQEFFSSSNNFFQTEQIPTLVKRCSSFKQYDSNLMMQSSFPTTPVSSSSRTKFHQNPQEIFSEMEKKKSEIQSSLKIQRENEVKRSKSKDKFEQQPKLRQQLIEVSNQKNQADFLQKVNLKFKMQGQSKGSTVVDLDKTRPESEKESKKDLIYKKQLSKLSVVFKKHGNF